MSRQHFRVEFNGTARQDKVQQITNIVCALLNTVGGQVDIYIDDCFPKYAIHELIRTIEQRFNNIIGALATSERIIQQSVTPQRITFVISATNDHLCTLSYNLYLPSSTITKSQCVEPSEPITAIERLVEGTQKSTHRLLTELGSHHKTFIRNQEVGEDFLSCHNVICKPIKTTGRNVKDEMINKKSKFQSDVSALANETGGHIYHGISKSGDVVGVHLNENMIQIITSGIEKALGKLIWGRHENPVRAREWDIHFVPVKDEDGAIIDQLFIIVVSIAPYKGGVFTAEPDCYHVVEDKVEKMDFITWKKELLRRRILRQCNSIDEHVDSINV